ncbi:MAG: transcriptional coactivator p15/PC4 family protein [bacterium]
MYPNDLNNPNDIPYVEIERTPTQIVRINLDTFKGRDILNIRVWVLKGGKWIPTKRGINLYPHEIPALEEAIQYEKEDLELDDPDEVLEQTGPVTTDPAGPHDPPVPS